MAKDREKGVVCELLLRLEHNLRAAAKESRARIPHVEAVALNGAWAGVWRAFGALEYEVCR